MRNEYEIDKILDQTVIDEKPHYLVKWKNYSSTESTWEPIQNLLDELDFVHSWKLKSNPGLIKKLRRKSKQPSVEPGMEIEQEQKNVWSNHGKNNKKKKQNKRKKLTIDESDSGNNSSCQFDNIKQQVGPFAFAQDLGPRKSRSKDRRRSQKDQFHKVSNTYQAQKQDDFENDINGFKKVGKITKEGLKRILWCFDWEGDKFCEVLLKDGRKVHMRKDDVKRICPDILLEYYDKVQRTLQ